MARNEEPSWWQKMIGACEHLRSQGVEGPLLLIRWTMFTIGKDPRRPGKPDNDNLPAV